MLQQFKKWLPVGITTTGILTCQTANILLTRLYYDKGGQSKWMATLVQSAGAPLILLPLLLFPQQPHKTVETDTVRDLKSKTAFIYITLGLITAFVNLMYCYGLLYLPVSTYALVCATQLAFNVVFAYFINKQKLTMLICNSVVLLTLSAAAVGLDSQSSGTSSSIPKGKYALGFMLTLAASATFSLILSLAQLAFTKVLGASSFRVVLELQMWTNLVATAVSVMGLFASGEWRGLGAEMAGFSTGRVSYVMTLVWAAVTWQIAAVGIFGLTFWVSSLFANVISTLSTPLVPVCAVVFFKDEMGGVKVVALLMAVWGFVSYSYQQYLDELKKKTALSDGGSGDEEGKELSTKVCVGC